ncbi:MAG: DUF4381 family protein [Lentimonas sp.]
MPALPEGPSFDRVRGPVEVPLLETWHIIGAILILVLLLAFIIWQYLQLRRRDSQHMPPPIPSRSAIADLERANELAEDDENFATLLVDCIRRYYESEMQVHAVGHTSEEFLRNLKGNTRLDTAYHESLRIFLKQCDTIKFAQASTTEEQRKKLIESAQDLIHRAEQARRAV